MSRKNRDPVICASIKIATEERATSSLEAVSLSISAGQEKSRMSPFPLGRLKNFERARAGWRGTLEES